MAGLMSKVAFASKISVLMKATSDDINPTPGYLYDEINKITNEQLEYCDHLQEFLIERLKKKSVFVKLKVLLVLKHLVRDGNPEFSKGLRRQAEPIRETQGLSGPPDPLHGDEFYVKVRLTAKEVLEVLFNLESTPPRENIPAKPVMQGFGNSTGQSETFMKSVIGKVKEAVPNVMSTLGMTSALGMTSSPNKQEKDSTSYQKYVEPNSRPAVGQPSNTLWGWNTSKDTSNHSNTQSSTWDGNGDSSAPSQWGGSNFSQPATWGGGSTQNEISSFERTDSISTWDIISTKDYSVNWLNKTSHRNDDNIAGSPYNSKRVDVHYNEKKIVNEIATVHGIRIQPQKQDLANFIKRCETLDSDVIVKQLSMKLDEGDSRVQLRTMYVIENLLESRIKDIDTMIKTECREKLEKFRNTTNSSTRTKALKLLNHMDIDITDSTTNLVPKQSSSSNTTSGSLSTNMPTTDNFFSNMVTVSSNQTAVNKNNSNLLDLQLDPFESLTTKTNTQLVASNNESNIEFFSNFDELRINPSKNESLKTNSSNYAEGFGGFSSIITTTMQSAISPNIKTSDTNFDPFQNSSLNKNSNTSKANEGLNGFDSLAQRHSSNREDFNVFKSASVVTHTENVLSTNSNQNNSLDLFSYSSQQTVQNHSISKNVDSIDFSMMSQPQTNFNVVGKTQPINSIGNTVQSQPHSNFSMSGNAQSNNILGSNQQNFSMTSNLGSQQTMNFQSVGNQQNQQSNFGNPQFSQSNFGLMGNQKTQQQNFGMTSNSQTGQSHFSMIGNQQTQQANFGMMSNQQNKPPNFGMIGNPQAQQSNFSIMGNPQNQESNYSMSGNSAMYQQQSIPNFSFINRPSSRKKSSDAFSFVQDAMVASRKK